MSGLFGGGGGQNTSTSETPATGVQFQSSANGLPIPIIFGKTRVSPNLIWYGDFTAVPHTTTQSSGSGGKGGGGGSTSSNTTYTYTASFALALGEGPLYSVPQVWISKEAPVAASSLFTAFLGGYSQAPWSYLTGAHPTQALNYRGIGYAAANGYDLGNSASLPNHNFEVVGLLPLNVGGGVYDADPRDIVNELLTNAHWGVPGFPAAAIGSLDAYSTYCKASGLLFSPAYTEQVSAAQMITDLVQLTNSGVYFSEALLKITPYGDSNATGNGVTYTPDLTIRGYLGDDDYIVSGDEDPVTVKRNAIATTVGTSSDAYNQVQVEFLNRANNYIAEPVTAQDQAAIDTYGLRPMPLITAHQIADAGVAQAVAQLILQRSVYIRNQYEFKLSWQWCALEPTDLLCLTDSAIELANRVVRVLSIEEDEEGTLSIVAEDAPPGAASHVVAPVPPSGGYNVDYNAAPGNVAQPILFEPPAALTNGGVGLEVWAAVSGGAAPWGGCNVWVSYDNVSYKLAGQVVNPARIGHLTAAITGVSTGPLSVQLDGLGGALLPATATEAAKLATLFYIGGSHPEFMAHQGATLTGTNAYNLSGLVRGCYGSTADTHAIGDPFVRLDGAVVGSGPLDLGMIGQVVYFKFQSYNQWGGGLQDLASLSPYSYTVTGAQAYGNPVTGLTATAVPGSDVLVKLAWTASPGADRYLIDQSGDGTTWQRTGEAKDVSWADAALYSSASRFRVAAVRGTAGPWSSPVFISISYTAYWDANTATPMWDANTATPAWS